MASSNSRHVRNGVRGSGGVGDTLQMGGHGVSNGEKFNGILGVAR